MIDFKLKNKWDIPSQSLPIIFIGAGGIIRNAHIPAYKKLNLNIPLVLIVIVVSSIFIFNCLTRFAQAAYD